MKYRNKNSVKLFYFSLVFTLIPVLGSNALGKTQIENLAIKGYDSVAYFTDSKAVKGSESYAYQWHGMTWIFLTKKNRNRFAANPKKYAPQYDGFCAWAMTEKRKALTDPEVWKIVNGKLYLNCSQSAYEKWIQDIPGHIKKADANWLEFSN